MRYRRSDGDGDQHGGAKLTAADGKGKQKQTEAARCCADDVDYKPHNLCAEKPTADMPEDHPGEVQPHTASQAT